MKAARRRLLGLALGLAAPLRLLAQSRKPWRIGYLAQADPAVGPDTLGQFKNGMKGLGYQEGRDYVLEVRNAGGNPQRLQRLADELAALRPDVIVASSTPPASAALRATRSIPIVMAISGDPVGSGLVKSLARPGGNVTGTALVFDELSGKWLELLLQLRPGLSNLAVVSNPTNVSMKGMLEPLAAAARAQKLNLTEYGFGPGTDAQALLAGLKGDQAEGLIILPDAYIRSRLRELVDGAERLRLPVITGVAAYAEAGALMSYGSDQREHYRRSAIYVDKILKGAKPADLPVELPTRFEFVINLKSAKAAGVTIPPSLLSRADKVIQ